MTALLRCTLHVISARGWSRFCLWIGFIYLGKPAGWWRAWLWLQRRADSQKGTYIQAPVRNLFRRWAWRCSPGSHPSPQLLPGSDNSYGLVRATWATLCESSVLDITYAVGSVKAISRTDLMREKREIRGGEERKGRLSWDFLKIILAYLEGQTSQNKAGGGGGF